VITRVEVEILRSKAESSKNKHPTKNKQQTKSSISTCAAVTLSLGRQMRNASIEPETVVVERSHASVADIAML